MVCRSTPISNRGFTLIEVVVALVIVVTAGILVSNAWSGNMLRLRKTELNHNVAVLLERKMVEMEGKYRGKPIDQIKEESGDFGADFPQYRWTFGAQPFVMPDLASALTSGDKSASEMLLMVVSKMREITSKAVAEATVTVFYKFNDKEIPYSVTTYFVDYDAPELESGLSL